MNVAMRTGELIKELNVLEKIAAKKPTIPVLSNVLVQADEMGKARLTTTDLEIGLSSVCIADIVEPGMMTLPARRLLDLVRAQSDTTCRFTQDGNSAAVNFSAGQFKSKLQALDAKDFPKLPDVAPEVITLPRKALRSALDQVRFAISDKDQSKYFMKAALMVLGEKSVTLIATDSSRLALSAVARSGSEVQSVLIPSKAIDELLVLLGEDGDESIEFSSSAQHLFFKIDQRLLTSRQIEGQFPAYDRIIPAADQRGITIRINRPHLMSVFRRHVLIADIIRLTVSENALDVSSLSQEVGEGTERMLVAYSGATINLHFRGQYVLDFLDAATSDAIDLSIRDEMSPALWHDGGYLNVIMPMRI